MLTWPRIGPWLSIAISILATQAVSQSVPASNINFAELEQVAIAGSFDAISIYEHAGQRQGFSSNDSTSVIAQQPNGFYEVLASADASILAMCSFVLKNNTFVGIMVGGNFTNIGNKTARSAALINPTTMEITPYPGIQGTVNAILCDKDTETVYVGGAFETPGLGSNAVAWVAASGWANLAFKGFDGPVYSIAKAPGGHIVFGGSFTGLQSQNTTNASSVQNRQVINLVTADIVSVGNATSGNNIVCPPNNTTNNSPWLLQGRTGSWQATTGFGFVPSTLRLYNTHQDNRGTQTWLLRRLPDMGIMRFSYVNPDNGRTETCDQRCPLSNDTNVLYQDFSFVDNQVGMNGIKIEVLEPYGLGGGLAGVELFQEQIFVYAQQRFNEPTCAVSSNASKVTTTGNWTPLPSRDSNTDYLYTVPGPTEITSTKIVFEPDIKQSGNYSILVYTPGCLQDSSCSARAVVNVSGTLTSSSLTSFTTMLSQTNYNDKYDRVYYGPIDTSSSFKPSVTIRPSGMQPAQFVVASRVRFELLNSTGGLNGLYEWDPTNTTVSTDFAASAINSAGRNLKPNARVLALASHNSTMFSAGQYTDDDFRNIMSFSNNNVSTLPQGGLNATVFTLYTDNDYLYCGGNFTGTGSPGGPTGLRNIAAFEYTTNNWTAIGAGLDGPVELISPMPMNISGRNETVVAFSGTFTNIVATGSSGNIPAKGFAIWIPSRKAWLASRPDLIKEILSGKLSATTKLPNDTWIGAGTLTSLGYNAVDIASLMSASSGSARVDQLPVNIQPGTNSTLSSNSSSSLTNLRDSFSPQTLGGVVTGLYYKRNNQNVTVLAGQFSAAGSNSTTIQNLMFVNYSNNNYITTGLPQGVESNSSFLVVETQNNLLIAGGIITGKVNSSTLGGVVLYDFDTSTYRQPQPAPLSGDNVTVRAIAVQNGGSNIYVGGQFEGTAQGLPCRSVCAYDTSTNQWNLVGGQLSGTVVGLYWTSTSQLVAAGNLTISGNRTGLAVYDTKQQSWSATGSPTIPGPVSVFVPKDPDGTQSYVAGTVSNGSTFLGHVSGNSYQPVVGFFQSNTTILGLDMVPLTSNHPKNDFLDADQALLVTGRLNITGFGPASGALFNGATMTPFILASTSDGNSGVVNQVFTARGFYFSSNRPQHSRGIAVLVALCAALGTIFLLILCGILLNYIQRRRAGYSTVPTVPYADKHSNINRVPPERLFGTLGQRPGAAPTV